MANRPLWDAMQRGELVGRDLWLRYLTIGGNYSPGEVMMHVAFGGVLDDFQHDLVVHVLNERFMEITDDRLPYLHDSMMPPGVNP